MIVKLDNVRFRAHRIAFALATGHDPGGRMVRRAKGGDLSLGEPAGLIPIAHEFRGVWSYMVERKRKPVARWPTR